MAKQIICENIKHLLQHAIEQPVTNKDAIVLSRKMLYRNTYRLHRENREHGLGLNAVTAILYHKYCSQVFMTHTLKGPHPMFDNRCASDIRDKFATLTDITSQQDMDEKYNTIVADFHGEHGFPHLKLVELSNNLDDYNDYVYYIAACNSNIQLEEELKDDIDKLSSPRERALTFMKDNQYMAWWITGVSIFFLVALG